MALDMELRGWTVYDVAKKTGKSSHTINKFLSSEVQTPKTALAIAQALGYSTARRYSIGVEVAA